MGLLTDGLLLAATMFAGIYCWVLARRVDALRDLDRGLGGAIVRLTRQIELARSTLDEARASARDSRQDLARLSGRAEAAAGQLRLLLAAVNDPGEPSAPRRRSETTPAAAPAAKASPPPRSSRAADPQRTDALPKPRPMPSLAARRAADGKGEEDILAALRAFAGGKG